MARLIVEEGGARRRFRLNEGRLSIGSGGDATLKLSAEGVADVHAELVFKDGEAVLRPAAPVTIGERVVERAVKLADGVPVTIGAAKLVLELDEGPAQAPAARPTRPVVTRGAGRTGRAAGAGARAARAGGAARGAAKGRRAEADTGRGRARVSSVTVGRHTIRRSLPSWAIVLIILAGAGVIYLALKRQAEGEIDDFDPKASQVRIEGKLANGEFEGVLIELEKVDEHRAELSEEWRQLFAGFRARAEKLEAEAEEAGRNLKGNPYWETQLRRFVDERLDEPNRPAARVLLARIAEFRRRWPTHPKLEWCDRMQERYEPVADLSSPPTWDDVEFEVRTMTWAMPRDYERAFELLDEFADTAEPADKGLAEARREELEAERVEYVEDRLLQAKYLWENKQYGQSVGWLAELVMKVGDKAMADDAAGRIVALGDSVVGLLAGYKRDRPEDFERMMRNEVLRTFAQEKGVL